MSALSLAQDRFFGPDQTQKRIALTLYEQIAALPILSPHGHVDPRLFADAQYAFGSPVDLFIQPDHYIFRMLYSQGIPLESLGIQPRLDTGIAVERDHRKIWQTFGEHFHLFYATPSGVWINAELHDIFGVREKLDASTAQAIYDQVAAQLADPAFTPRRLFERFNIETLCTTDAASDPLTQHQIIRESGWNGRILPTFRPDAVINLLTDGWQDEINRLSQAADVDIHDYAHFIAALENRRAFFIEMGAKATDHGAVTPFTTLLSAKEAHAIFARALRGEATPADAHAFSAHMLVEMARMSVEDGLVMQIHPGSFRNHNRALFDQFGADKGSDIPYAVAFTQSLHALLNRFGTDSRLRLIVFTLDETTYARELAPLAGHYPAMRLGPPWWFHDSLNGIARYLDQVMETAGLYNTCGFNDDTRAFCSIPARHDVWRRAACNWLGGLAARRIIDLDDAAVMARALAYDLAKEAYRL